ncbi:MAG TPA: HD domain-containing protein [Candidatus Paceibacterota bacterium]
MKNKITYIRKLIIWWISRIPSLLGGHSDYKPLGVNHTAKTDAFVDMFSGNFVENLNRNVAREKSMFNTPIREAIIFASNTHEIHQKQKRKGKDLPYIMHPLTVGLILAKAGAWDDRIVAGILHDTIEDSTTEHKVTYEILLAKFGPSVADIVRDVTEHNKELPWTIRKQEALEHLKTMEGPSLWVKTADVVSNVSEILDDYTHDGDVVFRRFNASKKDVIANYRAVVDVLIKKWTRDEPQEENPMMLDLKTLTRDLEKLEDGNS